MFNKTSKVECTKHSSSSVQLQIYSDSLFFIVSTKLIFPQENIFLWMFWHEKMSQKEEYFYYFSISCQLCYKLV